jgi:predicted nuclease of predicted toxin-antitoxin system
VKFKVDENLPVELAEELRVVGYDAVTVADQQLTGTADFDLAEVCRNESRVMVTLDLDFADIRTYPPEEYVGLIVLRIIRQDKLHVLDVFRKALDMVEREPLEGRLWIVEERRIRIR